MSRSQPFSIPGLLLRIPSLLPRMPRARMLCPLAFLLSVGCTLPALYAAAEPQSSPQSLAAQIEHDRSLIDDADRLKLTDAAKGSLWARLGGEYEDQMRYQESEDAYTRALNLLEHAPDAQDRYALALDNLASLYMLTRRLDAAERLGKQAIDVAERLGNPLTIARAEAHLGEVFLLTGQNKKAAGLAVKASRSLTGDDRASALLTYAYASCRNKHCREGEQAAHEAINMFHSMTPSEHFALGEAYLALGFVQQHTGKVAEAGENMREGIRVLDVDLPPTSPLLQGALEQYRKYLAENHRDEEAARIQARELSAAEPCASCTISVRGLR